MPSEAGILAPSGGWMYFHGMATETLARRLGMTEHVSPLLMKARRLGLSSEVELSELAIRRGCDYYSSLNPASAVLNEELPLEIETPVPAVTQSQFSNEELAIALLAPGVPYSQQRLRFGGAMLGADGNKAEEIVALAKQERAEIPVRYIAGLGCKVEPDNPFWEALLDQLGGTVELPPDRLPHITRFVAMTGYTRRGRETVMQWIRTNPRNAA